MSEQRGRAEHVSVGAGAANLGDDERARAFEVRRAEQYGRPTLDHFRRAYREFGTEWPGDDVVRGRHLVAD